ncbi:MAG: deoxyribodipyrimidine photo-lyase [Acidobacteriota bacterium]|nr:deoxyribodipyrimidine photo-lyase [Acidobacteriota bacterium]
MPVESERISKLNARDDRREAEYVLYWCQMNRRVDVNHALLYAVELANKYNLPVLFYEGLTCTYEYANDRLHTFILEAVPETARRLKKAGIGYVFYLRRTKASRNDVLYELARKAAAVVTDDYPTFIARTHNTRVPAKLNVAYYAVDSSCVVPMSQISTRQYGAYTIRPKIKKLLPNYLKEPTELRVKRRYLGPASEFHTEVTERNIAELVSTCEIDHSVAPSLSFEGGRLHAEKLVDYFLDQNLRRYANGRNEPSEHATSHMSPYLHFGQISSLELALRVRDYVREHKLIADEYLEELIVRRELGFNYTRFVERPGSLQNLPDWCQETMRKHEQDRREQTYSAKQLNDAETYDALWNATQKEMLLRGKIHGYYRMYWGKKIIEWTQHYQDAADIMIEIHDRFALDGRDPNTYTNILWCFGLHDRAWPERPIFGKMRYMSLEGMKRKTNTEAYISEIREMERTGRDVAKHI